MEYRNVSYAFIDAVKKVEKCGKIIFPRGFKSKELIAQKLTVYHPKERVVIIPYRYNNIFASIAETIWVLGGRNDLFYLEHYLPRARDFSDDQKTWRGAYGPRLRNWRGVDQIKEVYKILRQEDSKRAVISLFDPFLDYTDSKDIPCNNWLQFLKRDNKLFLNVTVRANDLFWGFSGINSFEWSVLQEMMSFWTNTQTADLTFFIGSLHFYERHFKYIDNMLSSFSNKTIYEYGFPSLKFSTPLKDFDEVLLYWFKLENEIRIYGQEVFKDTENLKDDFLRSSLQMLIIYNEFLNSASEAKIKKLISNLPKSDFKIAAMEFFYRKYKDISFLSIEKEEEQCLKYILNI